jgi:hypothetical protein
VAAEVSSGSLAVADAPCSLMKKILYGVPLGAAAAFVRPAAELDAPVPLLAEAGDDAPLLALVLLLLHAAAVTATTAAPAISPRRFIEPTYLCPDAAMSASFHPVKPLTTIDTAEY